MRLLRFLVIFSLTPLTAWSQRVALIDASAKSFLISDLGTGKVEKKITLSDPPTRLTVTPDRSKFIVLSRGAGKLSFTDEFLPTAKGSVTVIDAKTLDVIGRAETGWGELGDFSVTPDSRRIYVSSSGAKNGKVASLHAIDLQKVTEAGTVTWLRPCGGYPDPRCGFAVSADGKSGAIFFHGTARAQNPTMMKFVDLEAMKESSSVELVARTEAPVILPGGDTFFLLDNPLSREGTLYAISFSKRALAGQFKVGGNAKIAAADGKRNIVYVIGQTQAKGIKHHNGRLQSFRDATQLGDIKTVDYPTAAKLTSDGKRLYVLSSWQLASVDTEAFKSNDIDTKIEMQQDFLLSNDGRRAFFYIAQDQAYCCGLATFDLRESKPVKTIELGSTGSRFVQALAAVAASVESYQSNKAAAKKSGKSSFTYSIYQPEIAKAESGMMHLREDGKSVWAIDPQSGGVTAVDTETGEIRKRLAPKFATHSITPLGGKYLAAVGERGVVIIDAGADTIVDEWALSGSDKIVIHEVGRSDDLRSAVVLSAAGARGIGTDGKLQPMVEGTKNVVDYLFFP